jgi:hypothetical protein
MYIKFDKFDKENTMEYMIQDFQKRKLRLKKNRISKFKKFFIQFKSTHTFKLIV